MANTLEQRKVMDFAADQFIQDLRVLLVASSPEQRLAIGQFVDLIEKHYLTAGYRRIIDRTRTLRPVMK